MCVHYLHVKRTFTYQKLRNNEPEINEVGFLQETACYEVQKLEKKMGVLFTYIFYIISGFSFNNFYSLKDKQ